MTPGKQISRLKTKINFKRLASIELTDFQNPEKPADCKERLQRLELLAAKLKVQLRICAFWIIFTVAAYFLIWYNFECWALPFQESPCKQPRATPLVATDRNTLAEAVDEFIDLVGFGALKREDERLKNVEEAIAEGYLLFPVICIISMIFMFILAHAVYSCQQPVIGSKTMNSLDEQENSQEESLNREFSKMGTFITAPIEVRSAMWLFEIEDIDAHIAHYQDLKQYHVDQRTMPRKVARHILPNAFWIFESIGSFIFSIPFGFICWTNQKGSVWRVFKCLRIEKLKCLQDSCVTVKADNQSFLGMTSQS